MRTTLIASVAAGALLSAGLGVPALAVEPGKAELSVLHGVPGLTVDVYVNGALTLDDFTPGTLAGPLSLDPGTYTVVLAAEDSTDDSAPLLGPIDLPLAADTSYTAVAHLTAAGDPTATLFTNDISATDSGEGRLTVRHTAAAPAVDIWANGSPVFEGVENPDEGVVDVPADTYAAAVAAAGTETVVLGPADVTIEEGVNTIVYAWGSLDDDNLALAVQVVDVAMGDPSEVQAGSAGFAADRGAPLGVLLAGLAALVAAALVIRFMAVRQQR